MAAGGVLLLLVLLRRWLRVAWRPVQVLQFPLARLLGLAGQLPLLRLALVLHLAQLLTAAVGARLPPLLRPPVNSLLHYLPANSTTA
jgi:hypothetical protein